MLISDAVYGSRTLSSIMYSWLYIVRFQRNCEETLACSYIATYTSSLLPNVQRRKTTRGLIGEH